MCLTSNSNQFYCFANVTAKVGGMLRTTHVLCNENHIWIGLRKRATLNFLVVALFLTFDDGVHPWLMRSHCKLIF